MKKVVKNNKDSEMDRYLGALNEMHGQTLKGIKEGFILANKRFDDVDKRFDDVDNRFDNVDKRFVYTDKRLNNIEKSFDNVNKKLDSHTEMIGILMEDISYIKNDLKKKVDYDEFLSLVKRVQMLESKR